MSNGTTSTTEAPMTSTVFTTEYDYLSTTEHDHLSTTESELTYTSTESTTIVDTTTELLTSTLPTSTVLSTRLSTIFDGPTFTGSTTTTGTYTIWIGALLAVLSTLFIGTSFIVKKKALLRIGRQNTSRAGLGGYGYLKEWMWWLGLILMAVGELANLIAYGFAPATLVTPLGALSVLVSAVLSSHFLNERLNILGKIGCLMCILGSVLIVIHAPHTEVVYDMKILAQMLIQPGFLVYLILIIIISLVLMYYFGPRYGNTNMLIYIIICSVIGSLSVMACKGIAVAIFETAAGKNQFGNWLTWLCILGLLASVSVQMNYLNKALDIYNTSIVSAIYYVFFTSAVLVASAILFREWANMSATNLIGVFTGFAVIICAIFLLNVFKDYDLTLGTVREFINNTGPSDAGTSSDETVTFVAPEKRSQVYEGSGSSTNARNYESLSDTGRRSDGPIYLPKSITNSKNNT